MGKSAATTTIGIDRGTETQGQGERERDKGTKGNSYGWERGEEKGLLKRRQRDGQIERRQAKGVEGEWMKGNERDERDEKKICENWGRG